MRCLPIQPTSIRTGSIFVRVTSTTAAVAQVEALGGRVLVAPHLGRHGGLIAVVADPAGAPFGLLEWTDTDSKEVAK